MEFTLKKEHRTAQLKVGGTPRVDLLPPEIAQRRVQRRLFKDWGVRIAAALALVALVCVGLFGWQAASAIQLAAVRAEGESLLSQISAKNEIQALLDSERALTGFRDEATAIDLSWSDALGRIHQALPADAWVCAFSLTVGGAPVGEPATSAGLTGTVEICGSFPSAIPFLRDIKAVDGVATVIILESAWEQDTSSYRHSMQVELDQTVYAQFAAEQTVSGNSAETNAPASEDTDETVSEDAEETTR